MFTIRIKTVSTKKFSWNSSGCRSRGGGVGTGLRETVIEAITDFRTYAAGDGTHDGLHACLVTWEDGDDLHAFICNRPDRVPDDLPWILMRSQPESVTRERG